MKTIEELIADGATVKHWGDDYTIKETFKGFVYMEQASGEGGTAMEKIEDVLESWQYEETERLANAKALDGGAPIVELFEQTGIIHTGEKDLNQEQEYYNKEDSIHHEIWNSIYDGGFHHTKLGFEIMSHMNTFLHSRDASARVFMHSYTNTGFHTEISVRLKTEFCTYHTCEGEGRGIVIKPNGPDFFNDSRYHLNYDFNKWLADIEIAFEVFWMNIEQDLDEIIETKGKTFKSKCGKFIFKLNGFGWERGRDENGRDTYEQTDLSQYSVERCEIYGNNRYKHGLSGTAAVPKMTGTMTKDELRVKLRGYFDEMVEATGVKLPYEELEAREIANWQEMMVKHAEANA